MPGKPEMHSSSAIHLSHAQAAALTLQQQYLSTPAAGPMAAVRRLIALQAQYQAGIPVAVWARCPSTPPGWVEESLYTNRCLVRTWCLRGTMHVAASQDLSLLAQAVGQYEAEFHNRMTVKYQSVDQEALQKLNLEILAALEKRVLSRKELHQAVPALGKFEAASWGSDVKGLGCQGEIVVAQPDGNETRFARRCDWLEGLEWKPLPVEASRSELLMRYLEGYGPASLQDFCHWSRLPATNAKQVVEGCRDELLAIKIDGQRGDYYLRKQDEPLIQEVQSNGSIPEVRLLPKFDPLLLGYKNKERFIDEENLPQVYRKAGQVEAVVLLNGRLAASWRSSVQGKKLHFIITPFSKLEPEHLKAIEAEVDRLGTFLKAGEISLSVENTG